MDILLCKKKNRKPYFYMQEKYDLFYSKLIKEEQNINFMQKYNVLNNKLKEEEKY